MLTRDLTSLAPPLGPVPRRQRIAALDVTRGVAVLGVLLMNIWAFAGPQAFFDYPVAIADRAGEPVATWAVIHTLFEGSQRTLLSLLFGAGAMLSLQRFEAAGGAVSARRTYYRRTFALIALGLVNAYLFLWPADILFVYGLAGLCLYPLRNLRTPRCSSSCWQRWRCPRDCGWRISRTCARWSPPPRWRATPARRRETRRRRAAGHRGLGQENQQGPPPRDGRRIAADIRTMQSGTLAEVRRAPGQGQPDPADHRHGQLVVPGRAGDDDPRHGALSERYPDHSPAARTLPGDDDGRLCGRPAPGRVADSHAARLGFSSAAVEITKLTYDVRRLAMMLGYLGVLLLFCQAGAGAAIRRALAAAGRMALTNYLAQSILCALIFYGFGLGLYGRLTGYPLYGVVALVWAVEIAWSVAWLRRFQIGPFEWLWRSFTYRRWQPWHDQPDGAGSSRQGENAHGTSL